MDETGAFETTVDIQAGITLIKVVASTAAGEESVVIVVTFEEEEES